MTTFFRKVLSKISMPTLALREGTLALSRIARAGGESVLLLLLLAACTPSVPTTFEEATTPPPVTPNNFDATLPPNIAPLNFRILQGDASEAVTRLHSKRGGEIIVAGWDVCFDDDEWHHLLDQTRGDSLYCDIYLKAYGTWEHLPTQRFYVAEDEIDPYITYRLIRPSYVTYEELTINERCLENFDERVVYENMRFADSQQGQCINCHMPRAWNSDAQSQFHVRQNLGGTVLINGNSATKVNLKTDSTLSASVYPAWHPTLPLIAYSVNETGQVFHTLDPQKIEVIDYASDLILYDVQTNTVQSIDRTASDFESFPAWSPDGGTLYYIAAHYTPRADNLDADLDANYDQLRYNIYARNFDLTTRRFGARRLVFDAESLGKSASVPRVSPDGQYLLFTLADYGQFHIWHKSADLQILSLNPTPSPVGEKSNPSTDSPTPSKETSAGSQSPLPHVTHTGSEALNSPSSESYHAWSSTGRWILFSSRRDDGNYTRLYISYFDRDGRAHHPFRLPQRTADADDLMLRSYNAAEFLVQPVQATPHTLSRAIKADARPASYAGSALLHPEADTTRARQLTPPAERRSASVGY